MTSPTPTRQELPLVLRALDRLAQEHHEETQVQRQERLVALTQAACQEEGLNIPMDRVAATVAQLLDEEHLPAKTEGGLVGQAPQVPPQVIAEPSEGHTSPRWRRPTSLSGWLSRHQHHQRWWVRGVRRMAALSNTEEWLLNTSTLLGMSFLGAALGHWMGSWVGPQCSEALTVLGALGGSGALAWWAERLANEHHSLQPEAMRPGLAEEVHFCREARAYHVACEASDIPLLRGDLDVLRRLVREHAWKKTASD